MSAKIAPNPLETRETRLRPRPGPDCAVNYRCGAPKAKPKPVTADISGLLALHGIDVFWAGKGPRAHVSGISGNRLVDSGRKGSITLDEFRHSRREAEHVFKHKDLPIAGRTRANADRRNGHCGSQLPSKRLCDRLDNHGKGPGLGNGDRVFLDAGPVGFFATLRLE